MSQLQVIFDDIIIVARSGYGSRDCDLSHSDDRLGEASFVLLV